MSWTLTKKLDTFSGPGEIKKREVVLDPQVSTGEIKSREVELGLKVGLLLPQLLLNSNTTDIVFVTLFRTAVETAIALVHQLPRNGEGTLPLTFFLFWWRFTAFLVFWVGACYRAFTLLPPSPPRP